MVEAREYVERRAVVHADETHAVARAERLRRSFWFLAC
jgi:hypothetical protein